MIENNLCVDIQHYWKPSEEYEIVPTKKGPCLRPFEFKTFKHMIEEIETSLPELTDGKYCYEREDHEIKRVCFGVAFAILTISQTVENQADIVIHFRTLYLTYLKKAVE